MVGLTANGAAFYNKYSLTGALARSQVLTQSVSAIVGAKLSSGQLVVVANNI